jgi:hypothetical protein
MNTYYDDLKNPKWQKKRLEVLNKANFKCCICSNTEKELNVHHRYYDKNKKIWEYSDGNLFCLCKDCHGKYKELLEWLNIFLNPDPGFMSELIGYAVALNEIRRREIEHPVGLVTEDILNFNNPYISKESFIWGYAACNGLKPSELIEMTLNKSEGK